ncbi:hypothetical protein V8E51_003055 [Hyaloscypha variabilis]
MAPAARRLKHEAMISHGLMTPDESLYSAGSVIREMQPSLTLLKALFKESLNKTDSPSLVKAIRAWFLSNGGRSESHRKPQAPPSSSTALSTVAPANNGLMLLGHGTRKLVDTTDQLRKIGLESVDTKLPELVLVCDQSAGKSSLMGDLAETNLPNVFSPSNQPAASNHRRETQFARGFRTNPNVTTSLPSDLILSTTDWGLRRSWNGLSSFY